MMEVETDRPPDYGMKFGPYFLFGELGGGQKIEVWVAGEVLASGDRRSCIIKRVNPRYENFSALRELIDHEAESMAQLKHPGLIKLHGHGEIDGLPYLCLEFVDGVAVSQLGHLVSAPVLPHGAVVELGLRVCDALHFAHGLESPIIHGRLGPANVILGRNGSVKVADMALATATIQQVNASLVPNADRIGYLAPEQGRRFAHTPATDVFALGVILVELLAGRRLFPEGTSIVEDQAELVRRMCGKSPFGEPPKSLTEVLVKMTDFDFTSRISSIGVVLEEMRTISIAQSCNETVAMYLERNVFVRLPVLEQVKGNAGVTVGVQRPAGDAAAIEIEARTALLGSARAPGARVVTSSFPTTAAFLLDQVTYEQSIEFELVPRLPSSAMLESVPEVVPSEHETSVPPLVRRQSEPLDNFAQGTYRILGRGLDRLLSYDPYLRSIGLLEDQIDEAKDSRHWEYYFTFGDDVGPRILKKTLSNRLYREQEVVLLEGSEFLGNHVAELLTESSFLPRGSVSARGQSAILDLEDEKVEEFFLSTHELRVPRPSMQPSAPNAAKDRLFRFFRK
jgi:hypothetical protein